MVPPIHLTVSRIRLPPDPQRGKPKSGVAVMSCNLDPVSPAVLGRQPFSVDEPTCSTSSIPFTVAEEVRAPSLGLPHLNSAVTRPFRVSGFMRMGRGIRRLGLKTGQAKN